MLTFAGAGVKFIYHFYAGLPGHPGYGLNRAGYSELNALVINRARLWLDAGHIFGGGADQFQRVVLACPRATLREALERLERAINRQES